MRKITVMCAPNHVYTGLFTRKVDQKYWFKWYRYVLRYDTDKNMPTDLDKNGLYNFFGYLFTEKPIKLLEKESGFPHPVLQVTNVNLGHYL